MTEPVSSTTSSPPPALQSQSPSSSLPVCSSRILIFTVLVAVWASVAWAILWPVDKSCEFVYLTGHYVDDGGTDKSPVPIPGEYFIYRGTQRGMILPQDPCQPWRTYEDDGTLQLDTYMVTVRVSTALSIVFGFFLWIYITLITLRSNGCCGQFQRNSSRTKEGDAMEETSEQQHHTTSCCIRSCLEWTVKSRSMNFFAIFLSICVAVFQALTHLMVHSSLCEDSEPIEVVFETEEGSSQTVIYDTCLHDTTAYNLTFVTMFMWVALAIMIGFVPLSEQRREEEEEEDDDDDDNRPRQQQQQLQQKDDQASGFGVDDADDVTSRVDPSTTKNTIDCSDSSKNERDNIDV